MKMNSIILGSLISGDEGGVVGQLVRYHRSKRRRM
jgi:hypothetical protein